jgi:lysophospholipase L1-like esterase
MLGTNDVPDVDNISPKVYERQMRQIIEACINAGVIPLVSTIPAFHRPTADRVTVFNDILVKLTDEYDIPLWDYHAAMLGLPNDGLSSDGVHPSVAPNGAGSFTPDSLQYGFNVRNLTALQALDALWREVIRK